MPENKNWTDEDTRTWNACLDWVLREEPELCPSKDIAIERAEQRFREIQDQKPYPIIKVECKTCDGRGRFHPNEYDFTSSHYRPRHGVHWADDETLNCPDCRGEGEIEDEDVSI